MMTRLSLPALALSLLLCLLPAESKMPGPLSPEESHRATVHAGQSPASMTPAQLSAYNARKATEGDADDRMQQPYMNDLYGRPCTTYACMAAKGMTTILPNTENGVVWMCVMLFLIPATFAMHEDILYAFQQSALGRWFAKRAAAKRAAAKRAASK